ncbi:hypothetical protein [uncultured Serinicoccus sp.]|uniref:hypothetical protein n=1 Tax=uncultured Serinicoccus sp. TaxID=735514 RepID=UPI00262A1AB4|nr:hypothetical protein [uncultured Serinicoccus sp.]
MREQVLAEWQKLLTVRSTWVVLGLVLLVEAVLRSVGVVVAPDGSTADEALLAVRPSITFSTAVALLPALLATVEWRYGTVVSTYVVRPSRGAVLAAKLVVGGAVGAGTAVLGSAVGVGAALLVSAATGGPVPTPWALAVLLGSSPVAGALLGMSAVVCGHLLRDQAVTVTVLVVVLFVAPVPVALLSPAGYGYTPSGLVDALGGLGQVDVALVGPWTAAGLLTGLLLVLLAAARRDGRRDLV